MKKILLQFAAVMVCISLCMPAAFAARRNETMLQVGLAFSGSLETGALTAANLENNTGYGAGYRFGYFDDDLDFVELGYTSKRETAITVLRASEIYLSGSTYSTSRPSGKYQTIGCYHVVLGSYRDFEDALDEAEQYDDGFVAWIDGEYQVREGAYTTLNEAREACDRLDGEDVKGTSSYAVNVVETGSAHILFQFDGGSSLALGIMPDVTGADDVRTWFKGYRYHGGFRYERIGGGDLTVVNIVEMETYVAGLLPYEMKNTWPMEALKAQAVCARSYAYNKIKENSHSSSHFDICNTEDCQVYHGLGVANNTDYQANERTDQAVEETAGIYALYQGEPIIAYYSSSHGGGSERIDNVWNTKYLPYLCGVVDPYEEKAASINYYSSWTVTTTASQILQRLQANNYGQGNAIDCLELTYSPTGNVIQVRVIYTNRKSNTFTPKMSFGVRSLFGGLKSLHFTVNGQGASSGSAVTSSSGSIKVNETSTLEADQRVYTISGSGNTSRVDVDDLYTISDSGRIDELEAVSSGSAGSGTPTNTVVTVSGSTFVLEGSGNGHNLGMSQYGAYAMAQEGFTYDEIVEFYYPGVRVAEYD